MNDISPPSNFLPFLCDDLIYEILVHTDHKTLGKCVLLSKSCLHIITHPHFLYEHCKMTKSSESILLLHLRYPIWFVRSDWVTRVSIGGGGGGSPFHLPFKYRPYGWFQIIGADNGVLCMRFSSNGAKSKIIVWNPFTRDSCLIVDTVEHRGCTINCEHAFGYIPGTLDYVILHLFKHDRLANCNYFTTYSSISQVWATPVKVPVTNTIKLGSKAIVYEEIAYWINWIGPRYEEPGSVITFCFRTFIFDVIKIPEEVKANYGILAVHDNNICYLSYSHIVPRYSIDFWSLRRSVDGVVCWEKMFKLNSFSI